MEEVILDDDGLPHVVAFTVHLLMLDPQSYRVSQSTVQIGFGFGSKLDFSIYLDLGLRLDNKRFYRVRLC